MKRTDFSVDWLFAACAPDTELLPWNAQFTPVDLPHDWQIRHADDLYRDGTLFYRKYFFVTDATRRSGSTSPTRCMRARTRFLSAAICATPTPAGTPVRVCTAMWNCGRLPTST